MVTTVVVVLRSPIHANEPSEYNGMLYRTSNTVLNNGIKVIILICMDGTSQYHHHRNNRPVNFLVEQNSSLLVILFIFQLQLLRYARNTPGPGSICQYKEDGLVSRPPSLLTSMR